MNEDVIFISIIIAIIAFSVFLVFYPTYSMDLECKNIYGSEWFKSQSHPQCDCVNIYENTTGYECKVILWMEKMKREV